jgi:hypothetical protein
MIDKLCPPLDIEPIAERELAERAGRVGLPGIDEIPDTDSCKKEDGREKAFSPHDTRDYRDILTFVKTLPAIALW